MDKITWCLKQNNGIELVEPNENLRLAHIKKAEDSLIVSKTITIKNWQMTAAYYAIYHALYSLLMEIGIKCEIHSCTIEFIKIFLTDYFTEDDFKLIDLSFRARTDSQYYVNRIVSRKTYDFILKRMPLFLIKCKTIVLQQKEIELIRKNILIK